MKKGVRDNFIAFILSALGMMFLIYYIFRASTDVVASDYIRIIKYYIDDVENLQYLLAPEGIACIPFSFLERYINVKLFSFSVYFDKILGTFGYFIFNFINVKYILKNFENKFVKAVVSIVVSLISFSLMSWEMILNGTGYAHLITMGLIAVTFYLFDKANYKNFYEPKSSSLHDRKINILPLMYCVYGSANFILVFMARYIFVRTEYGMSSRYAIQYVYLTIGMVLILSKFIDSLFSNYDENVESLENENDPSNKILISVCVLTAFTSLLFAGSYAVSYLCTMILFSFMCIVVSALIKIKKNSIKDGTYDKLNVADIDNSYTHIKIRYYILLIIISFVCLILYWISSHSGEILEIVGAKDITLMELMKSEPTFIVRFLLKSFASSMIGVETFDYAIAFQTIDEKIIYIVGLIYFLIILWTLFILIYEICANVISKNKSKKADVNELKANDSENGRTKITFSKVFMFLISVACIVCLLTGHLATSSDELWKSDLRKNVYQNLENVAKNYEEYDDDTLMKTFEYFRNAEHIKEAFSILKSQKLNVFREE